MLKNSNNFYYFIIILIVNIIHAQINVACLGNSITQTGFPIPLQTRLGTNYEVIDYGAGGRTLLQNTDFPYIESYKHSWSIAIPHDVVLILLGTNDAKEQYIAEYSHFKDDYYDLMNDYINYPGHENPVFVIGLPPPVFENIYSIDNDRLVNFIIPTIRQIANETGTTVADFYSALDGRSELFPDGVHPNWDGEEIMAGVAYDAIIKAINRTYPPPITPTGLKTTSELDHVGLKWNANSEEDIFSYRVYRSDEKGGNQIYLKNVLSPDTTYLDYNVILNHIYYYSIDAMNNLGNTSKRTSPVAGETKDIIPPLAPINLQATLDADSVKLSWSANIEVDIKKYDIYRNTVLNDIQLSSNIIGTAYAPDSNFSDISFDSATNYFYGIKAVDISDNLSSMSNIINITTKSRPLSSDTTIILFEDTPHNFLVSDFPFTDADGHTLDKIIFINSDNPEHFTYDNDTIKAPFLCNDISKLLFSPKSDEFGEGYADFYFEVVDDMGSTSLDTNRIIINVAPVNDSPRIDPISDIYILEDSHNLLVPISGIGAGPVNESQNLTVRAFADFVNVKEIQYTSPEDSGFVIIDPANNAFGIIPMTVQIIDDGGNEFGGIDTSSTTFNIEIAPINDPPIFNFMDNIQIVEDSKTTVELMGVQPGPFETNQQITIAVQSNDTEILPHPELNYNSPDTTAILVFSTIPNIFGTSSITINMSDDNGTDLGGEDSISYIIPVEIISVNDKPNDFNITSPIGDSTFVINKSNYLNTFLVSWEPSSDIENDTISYNIIFNDNLSALSRRGLNTTSTEYVLKEILAATDTVSITNGSFSIIASDGDLETNAINGDISITVDGRSFAPANLHLDQNYPNPFNHFTVIGFDLPKPAKISIIIYDLLGEEVIKLINNKKFERGYNTVTWNSLDKNNIVITTGIYIMQIRMGHEVQHKKLIYIK